jgi:spore coat protein CotH
MNRYTTGQQFLGLKSFLLDNLLTDPTGIKETVAMRLYERMGLPAPREAHVALYVNNTFAGLYGIVESIDKDFLARVFGERAPGDTENDGYLFEYDWVGPWRWEYLGATYEVYSPRFDPQTHEQASMAELYAPIEEMVRAINQAPDFMAGVSPYLDLPLLMRHLAVQSFLAEPDGILGHAGTANFHFYRFEDSTRSQFIAWDEDRAFESPTWSIDTFFGDYVLMRRAMEVPELRAAYFQGLLDVTAVATDTGWLQQEILTRRAQVTPLLHADPLKPFTNADVEAAMEALVAFPAARAAYVRSEVARFTGR